MHVIEKIFNEIDHKLSWEYRVDIPTSDWKLFTRPLTNNRGKIDIVKFNKRQKKSTKIIKKILGYHGKSDIVKFLGELASIEPRIQELQPWVRDHVVHAINTFLLGVYILEKIHFPKSTFFRYDFKFAWKLCGPTHDLGYPLEIARNIQNRFVLKMNEILDKINTGSPKITEEAYPQNLDMLCNSQNANDSIQERLNEWELEFDIEEYYRWLKSKNRIDHGVISALAQLKVIDAIYQRNNPSRIKEDVTVDDLNFNENNFILDIVSASAALFIHNIDLKYYGFRNKIDFNIAPLAFLLYLCDIFQEWDRYSENRTVYSGNDFDIECSNNCISLYVPQELENRVFAALHQRLLGVSIRVNGGTAVA